MTRTGLDAGELEPDRLVLVQFFDPCVEQWQVGQVDLDGGEHFVFAESPPTASGLLLESPAASDRVVDHPSASLPACSRRYAWSGAGGRV
jgi:hypothetical protein